MGAKLKVVPTKPYSDPGNYQHVSKRLVEDLQSKGETSVMWANQFDNTANYKFHAKTTAKEIFNQLEGNVDGFTCAIGSGGTLAGTSIGLKELNSNIKKLVQIHKVPKCIIILNILNWKLKANHQKRRE